MIEKIREDEMMNNFLVHEEGSMRGSYAQGLDYGDSQSVFPLPLHHSAKYNKNIEIIKLLIREHPYGLLVENKYGASPLDLCEDNDNEDIQVLLSASEDAYRQNNYIALSELCGSSPILAALINGQFRKLCKEASDLKPPQNTEPVQSAIAFFENLSSTDRIAQLF